ncbi:NlpC/P60 family protein [Paenibacillus sepulcri]|uniref:C40 family peptidase n=1 Tax=Paenibacillus sepulcri TaxID=359917 RepID=A0ABS7C1R8_9BACL|nr:C40 family peptidase [Paenibacillus sepulcri]
MPEYKNGDKNNKKVRRKVISFARSYKGKLMYIFGEKEINIGYGDCSGFCNYVFSKTTGIDIGDKTSLQIKQGKKIPKNEARTGDIIFFKNTYRKAVSHVGIVTKPGYFIGLQSRGGCRERGYLNGFWKNKFMHIRRILNLSKSEMGKLKMVNNKASSTKNSPLIVNVHVVTSTGNPIKDSIIKKDLNRASKIWESSGITFRLKSITRHTDESYKFKNGEFSGGILLNKQPKKVQKLIRYSPKGSTRNDVVVIYMNSKSFKDVEAKRTTTGAIYFFGKKTGPRVATILLATNSRERAQMLAHELGHALFVNPVTGRSINPSRTMDPNETSHDSDKKNLMYPKPPSKPHINQTQREKAKKSTLIRTE